MPTNKEARAGKPKEGSPAKAWAAARPEPARYKKSGKKFGAADLPKKVPQHRAKPGMTSPQ